MHALSKSAEGSSEHLSLSTIGPSKNAKTMVIVTATSRKKKKVQEEKPKPDINNEEVSFLIQSINLKPPRTQAKKTRRNQVALQTYMTSLKSIEDETRNGCTQVQAS